jgi:PEP-CTERM/exosortase A-associated glycosyltransferase
MFPYKVCHILDHSVPVQSGYAFRSQAIISAQQKQGLEPFAITSPKHFESWNGTTLESESIAGVRYYRAESVPRSPVPFIGEARVMFALVRTLLSIVRREKPDLLHAHSPILNAFPALLVSRVLRIPVIYEMRSSWEDAGVDQGTYREGDWKYRLAKSLETLVCQRVDQVVALCQGLKTDLVNRGIPARKITVVPNGVDLSAFSSQARSPVGNFNLQLHGKKVIGFFGSFFHWEGLDLLVRAVGLLVAKRSDIVLLLIGGGVAERDLKEMIREQGLGAHVYMPGRVPQNEIPSLYEVADVLVYPRYSMRLTELVTPLKPLEAMAMGKAVIASDVGGHRELIEHGRTGFLFQAGNADALAQTIWRVLEDDDLRQMIATGGERWVRQERSWEKITRAYHEVYNRVI